MKNCLSCSKAKIFGSLVTCGFKPEKGFFNALPYYPVCLVSVRLNRIAIDKIPKANCSVWSEMKTGAVGHGEEFETMDQAIDAGVTSIKIPGKTKAISINPENFLNSKSKAKAKAKRKK